MSNTTETKLGIIISELLEGKPVICPRCAGWGTSLDRDYPTHPCQLCRGSRTMRRAKVSGEILVPIDAKPGEPVSGM